MICPDCDSDIPDKVGHSTCPECNTKLINSDKGLRSVQPYREPIKLGEVALVNGKLTRLSTNQVRQSHPIQPIYMIDNIMYMDCIGCNLPCAYLGMVKGKIWDLHTTTRLDKTEVKFGVNRSTDPISLVARLEEKTFHVPSWLHGSICPECVACKDRKVELVRSYDYDMDKRATPDYDRVFPKHRASKATVRVKSKKPTYKSRG